MRKLVMGVCHGSVLVMSMQQGMELAYTIYRIAYPLPGQKQCLLLLKKNMIVSLGIKY